MRTLIHNGSEANHIKISWESTTTMKLQIKWPVFMSDATMLAGCLTSSKDLMDDDEDPFGDEDHQVYVDMAKNTEQLCDSNGEIYSEGLFFFKKPIDEQK